MERSTALLTALAIIMAGVVLLPPVECTMHQQRIIDKAIASGADPIAARCAFEGTNGTSSICLLRAAQPASSPR